MSTPKELRERFARPEDIQSPLLSEVIGIISDDMREIIIADIEAMIDKKLRTAMEGYIFCLSRIMRHDLAWEYITAAFSSKNEKVPTKYYTQFGQTEELIAKKKGIVVK